MEKILETPRLYLRCLQLTDAMRMSEYRSKKEVAHYQSWKKYSVKDATKRIQQCLKFTSFYLPKTNYHLAVILKDNDIMIGDLFVDVVNEKVFVLGYTLDSVYWSKGYGSEIVEAFCQYMKETYHFQKVICYVYKDNQQSIHLLKKLQFHQFEESYFYHDVGYMKYL